MSRRWLRHLGVVIAIGFMAWVLHSAAQSWTELGPQAFHLQPRPLLASASALLAAYWIRALLYAYLVKRVDPNTNTLTASRIFFASQLGRYLPGKVWQFAGAGILARAHGTSPAAAIWSSTVIAVLHHMIGTLVALLLVQRFFDAQIEVALAIIAIGIAGLAFLSSRTPHRWIERIAKRYGRESLTVTPESWPSFGLLAWMAPCFVVVWGLFGLALGLLIVGILGPQASISWTEASGVIAASCVMGYVVLIAPSGLGVREAAMAALLTPFLGLAASSAIAIAMRIEMTLVEGLLIAWGVATTPKDNPPDLAESG